MDLEEAKNILDNLKNAIGTGMCKFNNKIDMNKDTGYIEAIETVLKALENSIDKQIIKEKIEVLESNKKYLSKFNDWKEKDYTNEDNINNCIEVLQELLEEK